MEFATASVGSMAEESTFAITAVENGGEWFTFDSYDRMGGPLYEYRHGVEFYRDGVVNLRLRNASSRVFKIASIHAPRDYVEIVRYFYGLKVGEVVTFWRETREVIDFKYAKLSFGDVFDFYTTNDGVLRLPKWYHLKHALDEYLEDPRHKYHPLRVQEFINEHGIENLELME